jgi:hypothetical protein
MIEVDCPHCGEDLEFDDAASGEVVRCPACKKKVTLPAPMAVAKKSDTSKSDPAIKPANPVAGFVALAILVLIGIGFISSFGGKTEKPIDKNAVTYEKYESLKTGMSYDDVVKIMGGEGQEVSMIGEGQFKMRTVIWDAGFLSNVTVVFTGGRLSSKSQIGLK